MVILTVFLTTLGLLFIKTNYEVITPAVVTPVDDYMTIGNDKKSKLDINTTSIYGFKTNAVTPSNKPSGTIKIKAMIILNITGLIYGYILFKRYA